MNLTWIQITGLALLVLSAISLLLGIWSYLDERKAKKNQVQKYYRQTKTPAYTEEEQFYANLLLRKNDLDADAFATRRAMFDEALRQQRK